MSYILDALRRADAERERGRVPGIHSQVAPRAVAVPAPGSPRQGHKAIRPWLMGGAAGALALALAWTLVWWLPGGDKPDPTASPMAANGPVADAGTTAPRIAPDPPAPAAPAAPAEPVAANAPPAALPEPVRPILAPEPPSPPPAPAPRAAPEAASATPSPADATANANADANLPRLADLPPDARAQIPPMQVSGATHSDNAALRMLIVNGKVVQEGQDIAPGLKLETIGRNAAIVNHQGRRLRLTY